MKADKEIKDALINLVRQIQVSGIPDTPEFQKSIETYQKVKKFVEELEIEEKKLEEEKI